MGAGEESERLDHWCLFRSGSLPCAVPLQWVAEIIRDVRLTRLPLGPAPLAGLCALRRDVIPVFDLADRANETDGQAPEGTASVLVLRGGSGIWGYVVDEEGIEVAGATRADGAAGEVAWEGTAYTVVDPSASWHGLRSQVVSAYRASTSARRSTARPPAGAEREPRR